MQQINLREVRYSADNDEERHMPRGGCTVYCTLCTVHNSESSDAISVVGLTLGFKQRNYFQKQYENFYRKQVKTNCD